MVGPSYALANISADDQATVNWFVSQDESGAGNAPLILDPCPGTKLFVDLGREVTPETDGIGDFDTSADGNGTGTIVASATATPNESPALALMVEAAPSSSGTFTPDSGWTLLGASGFVYAQAVTGPVIGSGVLTSSAGWTVIAAIFKLFGSSVPTLAQPAIGGGGAWTTAQILTFTNPVVTDNTVLAFTQIGDNHGFASGIVVTDPDNPANVFTQVASQVDVGTATEVSIWQCTVAAGRAGFRVQFGAPAHLVSSASLQAMELPTGAAAVSNSGPTRGSIKIVDRAFEVCGSDFDEILGNGTFITRGTVGNDSLPVTMAATPQQLLLASAGTAYVFDLMANTLTAIPGVTFAGPVSQAAVCDGFFLLTIQNSKEFYVSAPLDATDWVTNGAAIVSVFADNIVSMLVHDREIWFWSDRDRTVYYDSGNIFPFDVIAGTTIQAGSAAKSSPARIDDRVLWLNADDNGTATVKMGSGYTPQRISNHALEFAMQGYARVDDAVGMTYQLQGHNFYAIYFPTPSTMWVFDTLTGMWHEESFWVGDSGRYQAAHRWNHMFAFGRHLVGDWQSGKVYEMQIPTQVGSAWTFVDDDGATIRRMRRAPHISKEQKWAFYHYLNLFVETGLGPIPPLAGTADAPLLVIVQSPDATFWAVRINDDGTFNKVSGVDGPETGVFMNFEGMSFQLTITNGGSLHFTQVADADYPETYPMATTPSLLLSGLIVGLF